MPKFHFKKIHILILLGGILLLLYPFLTLFANDDSLTYDVIVVGSDPEGISAALSSRRNHCRVLLIDTRHEVGGLYTSGMLSMLDMNYVGNNTFNTVNEGFFKEFYDAVAKEANIDIPKTKSYFNHLLKQEKIDTVLNAYDIRPLQSANKVRGLSYQKNGHLYKIKSKVIIDASLDARFSRLCGVPYRVGREELGMKNEYAAATLVFSVKGACWNKIRNYLNNDMCSYTGANNKVAWGYPHMLNYKPSSKDFQLRRLNLSLQDDGSVIINAFQIFNTNSLNADDIKAKYKKAISELPKIVKFLNTHAVGFEKAILHQYADELYLREGVRIIGEYTLSGEDLFHQVDFKNKIAYGSYPMDLQATKKDHSGGTILTGRNLYTLPITIMIPKKVDNLLVVGRSASYDPLAHSSARTVPVGMALGQAAGILASYSIQQDLSVRNCGLKPHHVRQIQQALTQAGVVLDTPLNNYHPEKSSWAYPYIVSLRKRALLSMEYLLENDYRCQELATFETISRILLLLHSNSKIHVKCLNDALPRTTLLTKEKVVNLFNNLAGLDCMTLDELYQKQVIDKNTFIHLKNKHYLLNEDVYAIMYHLVNYLSIHQTSSY